MSYEVYNNICVSFFFLDMCLYDFTSSVLAVLVYKYIPRYIIIYTLFNPNVFDI